MYALVHDAKLVMHEYTYTRDDMSYAATIYMYVRIHAVIQMIMNCTVL